MTRKEYLNKCFSPDWLEVGPAKEAEEGHISKEERLESKRRKDLNTLLKELDDIRQSIEKAAEKQHRRPHPRGPQPRPGRHQRLSQPVVQQEQDYLRQQGSRQRL